MIPDELKAYPNWVVWRSEPNGGGKPSKVPYSPVTGRKASSTDPSCWCTYDEVLRAPGSFDGIGFMFSDSPYAGIDLDAPQSPQLEEWHWSIIEGLDSYTEVSPSGLGRHVIVRGSVPRGVKVSGRSIEIYSEGRYFTMTGNGSGTIRDCQDKLLHLWESISGEQPQNGINSPQGVLAKSVSCNLSDDALIAQASVAQNGEKFKGLWSGDISSHGNDHSAADQALMNILAFYTQDIDQLKRLFRSSGLNRKKAAREDYLDRTIRKSFDQMIPQVNFQLNGHHKQPEPVVEYPLNCPAGLVGEVAAFIYAASPYPIPEVSIAGALTLMAGICGRAYQYEGQGVNQYIMLLARAATGKEAAKSGIDKLIHELKSIIPTVDHFKGPRIASAEGLQKWLNDRPSCFTVTSEVGSYLKKLASPRASSHEVNISVMLRELYHKSGQKAIVEGFAYSKKTENNPNIESPAFSWLGEGTPGEFYEALDEPMVRNGLVTRFVILEYAGECPERNWEHSSATPSADLKQRLGDLVEYSIQLNRGNKTVQVSTDPETEKLSRDFERFCRLEREGTMDIARELWGRTWFKCMRLAALLAVGRNPWQPVVMPADFEWSRQLVLNDVRKLMGKFEKGQVGNPVNATQQDLDIRAQIAYYFSAEFEVRMQGYKVMPEVRDAGYVPLHFLRTRLRRVTSFRNAPDTNRSIDRAIKDLVEEGMLVEIKNKDPRTNTTSTFYRVASDMIEHNRTPVEQC